MIIWIKMLFEEHIPTCPYIYQQYSVVFPSPFTNDILYDALHLYFGDEAIFL